MREKELGMKEASDEGWQKIVEVSKMMQRMETDKIVNDEMSAL